MDFKEIILMALFYPSSHSMSSTYRGIRRTGHKNYARDAFTHDAHCLYRRGWLDGRIGAHTLG